MALKINNSDVVSDDRTLKNITAVDSITFNTLSNILSTAAIVSYDSLGAVPLNLTNGTLYYVSNENLLKIYDSAAGGRLLLSEPVNFPDPGSNPTVILGDISTMSLDSTMPALTIGTGGFFDDGSGQPSSILIDYMPNKNNTWQNSTLQHWNTSRLYTDSLGKKFGQCLFSTQVSTVNWSGSGYLLSSIRVDSDGNVTCPESHIRLSATIDGNTWNAVTDDLLVLPEFAFGWDSANDKKLIVLRKFADVFGFIDTTNPDSINITQLNDMDSTASVGGSRTKADWNPNTRSLTTANETWQGDSGPAVFVWDSSGGYASKPTTTWYSRGTTNMYTNSGASISANGPMCWLDDSHILIMNGNTNTAEKGTVWHWNGTTTTHSHYVTFDQSIQYCTFVQSPPGKNVLHLGDRAGFYEISGSEFTKLVTGSGNPAIGSINYYGKDTSTFLFGGFLYQPPTPPLIDGAMVAYWANSGTGKLGYRTINAIDGKASTNNREGDASFTSAFNNAGGTETIVGIVNGYILTVGPGALGVDHNFATYKGST
jgi:hypothetical protein